MKFTEIMLDLATGDASIEDAYIQEAVGKINVSSAYFDAAYKLAELPSDGEYSIVQEAADAGLPTDSEGAAGFANEALKQELSGFYDLIMHTSTKVKSVAEKNLKVLIGIGKKLGVSAEGDNFATGFAAPLAKAITDANGKKLSTEEKRFIKGSVIVPAAVGYVDGTAAILGAFGIDIDEALNDATVKALVGGGKTVKPENLRGICNQLSKGGKVLNMEKLDKDNSYTDSIKASDISDLAISIYAVMTATKAISAAMKGASTKKNALATIENAVSGEDGKKAKKIARDAECINRDVKTWTDNVTGVTDALTKAFGDSTTTLTATINGGKVPLPEKKED